MTLLKNELKDELFDFCNQMLITRDIDPSFYLIKGFCENMAMSWDQSYMFCFMFIGFFHFGSANRYLLNPSIDVSQLPYGKPRRGFRNSDQVLQFIQGGKDLRTKIIKHKNDKERGWRAIYQMLLLIRGCGDYSAYCLCHLFKIVLGMKITSPDVGFLDTAGNIRGPISGLAYITSLEESSLRRDVRLHKKVYEEMIEAVPFDGMEDFESILCNYLSLKKNTYYVGRDIDRQLPALAGLGKEWWDARSRYFPDELLGEKHGWSGMRMELMGKFEPGKIWSPPWKL